MDAEVKETGVGLCVSVWGRDAGEVEWVLEGVEVVRWAG